PVTVPGRALAGTAIVRGSVVGCPLVMLLHATGATPTKGWRAGTMRTVTVVKFCDEVNDTVRVVLAPGGSGAGTAPGVQVRGAGAALNRTTIPVDILATTNRMSHVEGRRCTRLIIDIPALSLLRSHALYLGIER